MGKRRVWVASAGVAVAVALVGAGAGIALGATQPSPDGDQDAPLTGAALERATAAALAHTGGGNVTETEVGDDGAAYSVEVGLADRRQVEVHLDANFTVIGQEADED